MAPPERVRSQPGPDADLHPEGVTVDATLEAWRRKASDILLATLAATYLPAILMMILGHSPPFKTQTGAVVFAVYLVVGASALCRWVEYRRRVRASVWALYAASFAASLINPSGVYAQLAVITIPIYVLVLLGAPAGRIAIVASTAIVVSSPLLRDQPGVIHLLGSHPTLEAEPHTVVWFRATVQTASLFAVMVLLGRFHRLLLNAIARQIAAQRKMEDEMNERQRLEREIAGVGDAERRHLGQELHDGVCQQLTAALLRCQALERRLDRGGTLSGADFTPISSLLAETIDDAHDVARGLCPLEPEADALAPALRALAKRTQEMAALPCEFRTAGDVRVPDPAAAQHLYRIAQEALSNAVRHASASRIAVDLRSSRGGLTLQVDDDGAGLPAERPGGGMGLRTMAYRARIMNGVLTVVPRPGGGTRVVCHVPLADAARAAGLHA